MSFSTPTPQSRDLPRDLYEAVEQERTPGERLLWTGQPEPLRTVRAEWSLFLFGLPWTAFALFWMTMAAGLSFNPATHTPHGIGWFFVLFGLPFVLVGFGMLSAPFVAMARARHTAYAITDRRILFIQKTRGGRQVNALVPRHVADLQRVERANGSGDLTLAPTTGSYRNNPHQLSSTPNGFCGIPEVHAVERLIRATFFENDLPPETGPAKPAQPRFGVGGYGGER